MFENMQMNMNSGIDLMMEIKIVEFEKKLKKKNDLSVEGKLGL